jgi:1-deoxy-D-xylulose-5-phosphate synthase
LNNTPVTLIVVSCGLSGIDDSHHVGIYDIALLSNIPNLVYMAPSDEAECIKMLEFARDASFPTAVRQALYPSYAIKRDYKNIPDIVAGKFEVIQKGRSVVLIGLGDCLYLARQTAGLLWKTRDITATIINPRFASHIDEELLFSLQAENNIFVTLENGIVDGGFGQKVAGFLGKYGARVLNFGVKKEFVDRIPITAQKERYRLTADKIVEDILPFLDGSARE